MFALLVNFECASGILTASYAEKHHRKTVQYYSNKNNLCQWIFGSLFTVFFNQYFDP